MQHKPDTSQSLAGEYRGTIDVYCIGTWLHRLLRFKIWLGARSFALEIERPFIVSGIRKPMRLSHASACFRARESAKLNGGVWQPYWLANTNNDERSLDIKNERSRSERHFQTPSVGLNSTVNVFWGTPECTLCHIKYEFRIEQGHL